MKAARATVCQLHALQYQNINYIQVEEPGKNLPTDPTFFEHVIRNIFSVSRVGGYNTAIIVLKFVQ